jgi:hypothetical protein
VAKVRELPTEVHQTTDARTADLASGEVVLVVRPYSTAAEV